MDMDLLYAGLCLLIAVAAGAIFFTANVLYAALCLLCVILGLSVLYALQGAALIAVMQVILHAGGILVLFVCILFLKPEAIVPQKKKLPYRKITCLGILLLVLSIIGWQLAATFPKLPSSQLSLATPSTTELSYQLVGPYGLVLELAGMLLLVTLIAVLYILTRYRH